MILEINYQLSPDFIVAASAALIALAALGVSIWQGVLTRRHNKLSVTPHLRLDGHLDYRNPIEITLENCGIGPAFIEQFVLELDGKAIGGSRRERIAKLLAALNLEQDVYFFTAVQGDSIKPGESQVLLSFPDSANNVVVNETIREVLPRVKFFIIYKSIYGDRFTTRGPTE